ncbi:hypothetical protein DSL92_03675 [Billgrantia gudaonensis]|uniref:Uncharacterized protein n=1 Tax=Billgrantia gudaonensis TaxID=376427 RepID=A0A3S0QRY8_9GAMM|nr:hypothetical protein DSL92_03675 [Halomonas gudaonensis]
MPTRAFADLREATSASACWTPEPAERFRRLAERHHQPGAGAGATHQSRQSMDALHRHPGRLQAVLLAACQAAALPMMMTAAGTLNPSRVFHHGAR